MIPQANQVFIVLFLKSVECAIRQADVVVAPRRLNQRSPRSVILVVHIVRLIVRHVALTDAVAVPFSHLPIHREDISCLWPMKLEQGTAQNGMELK
jgi:hypothetical protein